MNARVSLLNSFKSKLSVFSPGNTLPHLAVLFSCFILFVFAGCEKKVDEQNVPSFESANLREVEDEFDQIFSEKWEDGKPVRTTVRRFVKRYKKKFKRKTDDTGAEPPPLSPMHPLIEKWITTKDGNEVVDVVVSVAEYIKIPRFPEPDTRKPREDPINKKALQRSLEIVQEIIKKRRTYNEKLLDIISNVEGKVIDEFWLVPAMHVALPVKSIKPLLKYKNITYIEPVQTEDPPPDGPNGNPKDNIYAARFLIGSDTYFNQGLDGGWIGLLDSGVHRSHELLSNPDRIDRWRDCTSGAADCSGGNPDDNCWHHGTSAASIIAGNNNRGDQHRGVTGIMVDSWKVYPDSRKSSGECDGYINTEAVERAFEQAVLSQNKIIVAEIQGSGNELSKISQAANNAFDTGAVVIAANGNYGPTAGSVNAPAIAHKVIGVGAFGTESGDNLDSQSRGPTNDNRFKPDIQMPSHSEAASTGCYKFRPCALLSDTAYRIFSDTSGAVPYGGAAAALIRNWKRRVGQTDPGHVYASLIVSGQNPDPNNTIGAGHVSLPVNGYSWWGKVAVGHGEVVEIPLDVTSSSAKNLDGAIWWPESVGNHNDIDLEIVSPSDSIMDSSIFGSSVFEKVHLSGSVKPGVWKLMISGCSVSEGQQTVFYSVTVQD